MKTALVTLAVLVALASAAVGLSVGRASTGFSIRMFRAAAIAAPVSVTVGNDGALWFTNETTRSVGRITLGGLLTAFPAYAGSAPGAITTGGGGALWVFGNGSALARMTADGAMTEYPVLSAVNSASAPDGALWFTTGGESIGRMTPSGDVTLFVEQRKLRGTYGIAPGPDDAMWVTNYLGGSIARVDAAGAVTTFVAPCIRYPMGITKGPDGALWFADDSGKVGRITTAGDVTCFGDAARVGHPDAITAGHDSALWAADRGGSIVRVTTRGVLTRYTTTAIRFPSSVAAAPDNTIWFTDYSANAIGRITSTRQRSKPASLHPLPRVTLISDSVAASISFDIGAKSILASGVDLFLEPGQARTLGPVTPAGTAPATVLELIPQLGRRLGPTVVIEIGHNDYSHTYAANVEAALSALHAAGVKHVLWTTLHVTRSHTSYAIMNDAVAAAARQHPELTVLDWNAHAADHPEWFQPDGVHLTGDGPRALARFIHTNLVPLVVPDTTPTNEGHQRVGFASRVVGP